jgi:hypothetical protein
VTNRDLQVIYDVAKREMLDRQNTDFDSHLWPIFCVIKAYCGKNNLPIPSEPNRDFYAANPED